MLKVLTLNLNFYITKHGPWEARGEVVRRVIAAETPDILAFQAVRSDPAEYDGLSQAAQFRQWMPEYEHLVFEPAVEHENGVQEGSAILSRLPFSGSDRLPLTLLPGLDDTSPRVVVHARFDLPTGPFHLFNAHFSWVGEQAEKNLDEALPYFRRFDGKALLVGDLNTPSDSPLLERLRLAGWTDVWAEQHPGRPGYTFEAGAPSLRIDYAWANEPLKPHVRGIKITADQPHESGAQASDHYGLLVTLDL